MVEEGSIGPSDSRPKTRLLAQSTARIKTGLQTVVRPLSAEARVAVGLGVLAAVVVGIAAFRSAMFPDHIRPEEPAELHL
jgi:hypothetical protein